MYFKSSNFILSLPLIRKSDLNNVKECLVTEISIEENAFCVLISLQVKVFVPI